MTLTKVSGGILDPGINVAGIVTATGFDGPFTGGSSKNINAGIITATGFDLNGNGDISGNLVIGGNLTANGDFTTLNTTLREVEILRVDANTTAVAGIITQRGSGDIFSAYDTSTEVFKIADGGDVLVADKIVHLGDTNTFIRFPDAGDIISMTVGNYEKVKIELGDITITNAHLLLATDGRRLKLGTSGNFQLSHTGSVNIIQSFAGDIDYMSPNGSGHSFQINSQEKVRITSAGILELERGSAVDQAIDIKTTATTGASRIRFVESGTAKAQIAYSHANDQLEIIGATGNAVAFFAGGTQKATLTSDGKFGINEDTPTAELEVQPVGTACTSTIFIHAPQHNTSVASETILKFGYGHSGSPDGVGHIKMTEQAGNSFDADFIFGLPTNNGSGGSTTNERLRILSSGEVRIPAGSNTTSRLTFGGGINIYHDGNMKFENGTGYLKLQSSNNLYIDGDEIFLRNEGGTNRWKIDSSGHFLPGAVGSYNIGSTGAEIGNVFIADSKKVFLGSDQDTEIYHDGTHGYLTNTTGNLFVANTGTNYTYIDSNYIRIRNAAGNHMIDANNSGADQGVGLYYTPGAAGTEKLRTSATGITVTGEVAASQDYPNIRPTLDLNFAATKKLDPRITYRRTGSASFMDEFGKVVLVGGNFPRFDHDSTTRECKGLLLEESRTNYVIYSKMLEGWSYGVGSDVFSASSGSQLSTNPDGSSPAYHYVPSSSAGHHRYNEAVTVPTLNTNYVVSVFVKRVTVGSVSNLNRYVELEVTGNFNANSAGSGQSGSNGGSHVVYDLQDLTVHPGQSDNVRGYVGDAKLEAYPNDWYRLSYVFNPGSGSQFTGTIWWGHPSANTGDSGNEQGNNNPSFYFWGASVEQGSFLTSYIPTYGSTVTRGADLAEIDGEDFTDFFNQTEGTINCAYWLGNDNSGMRVFQINDSANSVIDIVAGSGSGAGGYGFVNTGGVAQANGGQSSTNANYLNKLHVTTLAYKANDIAGINRNTGVLTNDTSATLDGAYNRVTFYQHVNSADQLNGHLQRVQYYPKRLPDNQLKNLNNQ